MASAIGSHKATKRIQKELGSYQKEPPDFAPEIYINESKMSEVYILIEGPSETPYEGGLFVLQMILPPDYPMRPPAIVMLTPTGRFAVREKICTTFSDFHPETWSPSYNFSTIVKSFISFMTEDPDSFHVGHYKDPKRGNYGRASVAEKKQFAKNSRSENIKAGLDKYFPCIREDPKVYAERRKAAAAGPSSAAPAANGAGKTAATEPSAPETAPQAPAAAEKRKREEEAAKGKNTKQAKTAANQTPSKGKGAKKKGEVVVVDDEDDAVVVVDD